MDSAELGDFSPASILSTPEDDEFLRSLLSDVPNSNDSTPDSSPPHMFEDSTPDVSPVHWSQDLGPPVVPQLSELSLDLNHESLLYGSNFTEIGNYLNAPLTEVPTTPPKDITIPQSHIQIPSQLPLPTQIPLVPIVQPPIQALPIVQPPHIQLPIVVEPPKKNRASSKKRARADESPSVPSPQEQVALPRDTLLNITSQSMERYVETLQSTRHLSTDDQKELKRQKRLIKNRESAQLSRERKRAYIDQLEAKIAQLVADNGQLKNDNNSLREALARYQSGEVKMEPGALGKTVPSQHQIKMGNLLTIGTRSSATAGVCFMVAKYPSSPFAPNALDANAFEMRAMTPVDVGFKRGLLEAFPEVKEEENDTDFESAKFPALPITPTQATTATATTPKEPRQIIHFAGSSTPHSSPKFQPFKINKAGVFTVSYTPEPMSFVDNNSEHSHAQGSNSTFTLILDRRPDLEDLDTEMENASTPVSATHETQIQVASPVMKKHEPQFPPMIISLVIPDDIANGSNPFLLPEGLNPSNSMMEITCQVVDISITTSERPQD